MIQESAAIEFNRKMNIESEASAVGDLEESLRVRKKYYISVISNLTRCLYSQFFFPYYYLLFVTFRPK